MRFRDKIWVYAKWRGIQEARYITPVPEAQMCRDEHYVAISPAIPVGETWEIDGISDVAFLLKAIQTHVINRIEGVALFPTREEALRAEALDKRLEPLEKKDDGLCPWRR